MDATATKGTTRNNFVAISRNRFPKRPRTTKTHVSGDSHTQRLTVFLRQEVGYPYHPTSTKATKPSLFNGET